MTIRQLLSLSQVTYGTLVSLSFIVFLLNDSDTNGQLFAVSLLAFTLSFSIILLFLILKKLEYIDAKTPAPSEDIHGTIRDN